MLHDGTDPFGRDRRGSLVPHGSVPVSARRCRWQSVGMAYAACRPTGYLSNVRRRSQFNRPPPALLDLLKDRNVRVTFFLIGEHVTEATAPIVRRMFAEGHAIGQHSGDRWLMLHSESRLIAELQNEASRIELLTGYRPCPIFRPHAGWRSIPMFRTMSRLHYRLVGWSWLTWDWYWFRRRTGDRVAHQVLAHARPGKIIVIHDGHHRNSRADRQYALEATRRIIDGLRAKSHNFAAFCGSTSSQSTPVP